MGAMSKTAISSACACAGVVLLVFAGLWHSAAAMMAGLVLLVVSHALTPCLDRIAVWRKQLLK